MDHFPTEFRRVEHELLKEFQLKTFDLQFHDFECINIVQYKKIINGIRSRRKQTIDKKKIYQQTQKPYLNAEDSFFRSQILNHKLIAFDTHEVNLQKICKENFFLTENCLLNNSSKINEATEQKFKNSRFNSHFSLKSVLKSKIPEDNQLGQNQNLNLGDLNDKIYGQYSVLECLRHEQSQMEEAMFCFKKRIITLQEQLNTENIKLKYIKSLFVDNNNQMLEAKYTNQETILALNNTIKHFDLDLQSRKKIQIKFSQRNKTQFEESIIDHISLKKMKHQIASQEKQLAKLDSVRIQLEIKQTKYKSIYQKQQELYKAYEQIKNIDPNQWQKNFIVSAQDKEPSQFDRKKSKKKLQKSKKNIRKLNTNQLSSSSSIDSTLTRQQKLNSVVNQIVQLHKQMKHEQKSLINKFELLVFERDEKQAEYVRIVSQLSQIAQSLFEDKLAIKGLNKNKLQMLTRQIHQLTTKRNILNSVTNYIQERLKFYLLRKLYVFACLTEKWMIPDKVTTKFKDFIVIKFSQIYRNTTQQQPANQPETKKNLTAAAELASLSQINKRELLIQESKILLMNCFQNWKNYLGFLTIIHQCSYIYRLMSKSQLLKLFKRIIKTKFSQKFVSTEDIFQKAIQESFERGRTIHLKRIQNLLSVFKGFYSYFQKVFSQQIPLSCALNYEMLPSEVQQVDRNQRSSVGSCIQLQRDNTKRNAKSNIENHLFEEINVNQAAPSKQFYHSFAEPKKCKLSRNLKEEQLISRLKKKKNLKPLLNMHEFYEDLKEEIQKVNKVSAY